VPPLDEVFDNADFHTAAQGGENGLKGEYFSNENLQGPPVLTRVDKHINFIWESGSFAPNQPTDHFSVRWRGVFVPKETGDYKFVSSSDDGVRLYLDDEAVINDWQSHAETLDTYTKRMEAGHSYKIRFEYFESVGGATARFGVISAEAGIGRQTKELAAKADVVIVCVGFSPASEGEGADRTFQLPGGQDALIRQMLSVNKNTIVVLTAGGNVDMTRWIDDVPGLVHAWYPGQEGGTALAQILFGEYSPSGKLPVSFERRWEDSATYSSYYPKTGEKKVVYSEGVFLGYRHFDRSTTKPLFPFGFGLSYTTFAYSGLTVTPSSGDLAAPVVVSFDIRNSGAREAYEIAEVYVGDDHASVPRPVKELKGFARVLLKPGETRRVEIPLDRGAFSFYDVKKGEWNAEPGTFSFFVGESSVDTPLHSTFSLTR
jgi:beta-glucosidase